MGRNGLPEDSKLICRGKEVIGITTNDASFDYTQEGQKFLSGFQEEAKKKIP